MRRMSFALTTEQMRARRKWVTRRLGWAKLQPGTELLAVTKVMGLRKGEVPEVLGVIRVVSVRRERFDQILVDGYGQEEMLLEGFPGRDPQDFLFWFLAREPSIDPDSAITRIQFEHVDVPAGRV